MFILTVCGCIPTLKPLFSQILGQGATSQITWRDPANNTYHMKLGQGNDASSAKKKPAIGTLTLIVGAMGTTFWDHENDGVGMGLKIIAIENTVNVRRNSDFR